MCIYNYIHSWPEEQNILDVPVILLYNQGCTKLAIPMSTLVYYITYNKYKYMTIGSLRNELLNDKLEFTQTQLIPLTILSVFMHDKGL